MSAWAKAYSGSRGSTAPPFLDWTKSRDTRVKLDLSLTPDPKSTGQQPYGDSSPAPPRPPRAQAQGVIFPESSIDKIKSAVNAAPPPDAAKPFSTFQSLSAHIRRHDTQARSLRPEDVTVCTVFADCRNRVDPPVPESYFGNLIQAIFTGTAAGLILAHLPWFSAALIQKAIASHDTATINERNVQWEAAPKVFPFKDAGANCVAVGSSPRFKVYEVDFVWDKPEGVRSGSNKRFDGMVYLYQRKSGGRSIDVEISLEAGAMGWLGMDKAFLMDEEDSWKYFFF